MILNHFLISCLDCCLVPGRRRADRCGPAPWYLPCHSIHLCLPQRLLHSVFVIRHFSLFLRLLSHLIYLSHLFTLIPLFPLLSFSHTYFHFWSALFVFLLRSPANFLFFCLGIWFLSILSHFIFFPLFIFSWIPTINCFHFWSAWTIPFLFFIFSPNLPVFISHLIGLIPKRKWILFNFASFWPGVSVFLPLSDMLLYLLSSILPLSCVYLPSPPPQPSFSSACVALFPIYLAAHTPISPVVHLSSCQGAVRFTSARGQGGWL